MFGLPYLGDAARDDLTRFGRGIRSNSTRGLRGWLPSRGSIALTDDGRIGSARRGRGQHLFAAVDDLRTRAYGGEECLDTHLRHGLQHRVALGVLLGEPRGRVCPRMPHRLERE